MAFRPPKTETPGASKKKGSRLIGGVFRPQSDGRFFFPRPRFDPTHKTAIYDVGFALLAKRFSKNYQKKRTQTPRILQNQGSRVIPAVSAAPGGWYFF